MSIKMRIDGFDNLIKEIEQAGGNADKEAKKCVEVCAETLQDELKSKMASAGVDSGLISRMPSAEIEEDFGKFTARTGYKKGDYNPRNISDGYKAVFINYGTPRRTKHGQVEARDFIGKAKRSARAKIKREQEKTLSDILRGLKK